MMLPSISTGGAEQHTVPPCCGYTVTAGLFGGREERGGSRAGCFTWLSGKHLDRGTEHLGSIVSVPVASLKHWQLPVTSDHG